MKLKDGQKYRIKKINTGSRRVEQLYWKWEVGDILEFREGDHKCFSRLIGPEIEFGMGRHIRNGYDYSKLLEEVNEEKDKVTHEIKDETKQDTKCLKDQFELVCLRMVNEITIKSINDVCDVLKNRSRCDSCHCHRTLTLVKNYVHCLKQKHAEFMDELRSEE